MNYLTFIIIFFAGLWLGQHIDLRRIGVGKVFPLGIWYERWSFVHRIQIQVWGHRFSFWLNHYGKHKWTQSWDFWNFLPHYRWGVGSICGTPDGDFYFPYCEYRGWGKKTKKIEQKGWMK